MRKFERFYAEGDGISLLVEVKDDKGKILCSGDQYHGGISYYIDGYLDAVRENDEIEVVEIWTDVYAEEDFVWEEERKNERL